MILKSKKHKIQKVNNEPAPLWNNGFWKSIPVLSIDNYLWMENNYKPKVEFRICYTIEYLLVNFKAYENEITARVTQINDPVHKDSCVELFLNLFPNTSNKYFNFETNAIGAIHVGFGAVGNRTSLSIEDIEMIELKSKLTKPIQGTYGDDSWEVFYKIPFTLFEKHYNSKFNFGESIGNFYKCGDETKFEHYGVWNHIESTIPNFHLPYYFGDLIFC